MDQLNTPVTQQYWNTFYSGADVRTLLVPSQFGAFIAGELRNGELIVDLGCGTGRDSMFFSSLNHPVLGFDASEQAIARCTESAARAGVSARFECAPVGSEALHNRLTDALQTSKAGSVLVYTRFFLHAITEDVEDALLDLITQLAEGRRMRLAAEFRTHRDASLPKATSSHFRRFIDPTKFLAKVSRQGFAVDYFVEGFGYAKYKDDDAHVARVVLSR